MVVPIASGMNASHAPVVDFAENICGFVTFVPAIGGVIGHVSDCEEGATYTLKVKTNYACYCYESEPEPNRSGITHFNVDDEVLCEEPCFLEFPSGPEYVISAYVEISGLIIIELER